MPPDLDVNEYESRLREEHENSKCHLNTYEHRLCLVEYHCQMRINVKHYDLDKKNIYIDTRYTRYTGLPTTSTTYEHQSPVTQSNWATRPLKSGGQANYCR